LYLWLCARLSGLDAVIDPAILLYNNIIVYVGNMCSLDYNYMVVFFVSHNLLYGFKGLVLPHVGSYIFAQNTFFFLFGYVESSELAFLLM